ncbi:glycerophosphodiester phosphodiesterase [Sphingomonas ursincola]|uniref:glycerophosphodiester phosphodiesterase n=1 Tax=Blastomonas TaxID=150203 RepID=UPI00082C1D40|nr:glycerophosphodiester phosphodiesterase [Sphingomonas ursincola]MBA4779107.1 glycerophosphodiester phosphodiesterase [Blastomonas sp.]MBY0620880.1 glycerophosphodiester phosphodiesterase [Sphingomonas ursincola]MCH2239751.1 glycerophosphodiester phosphodiesterase [Blastomonas sp.]
MLAALALAMAANGPIVIAHRGASGERPEHTLGSYERAIDQGADYIEPDLVSTKDGVLVARHENEISETTDVAAHPEFADRKRTKTIDGQSLTGWFTEDFTLAELKTLRAKERLPQLRPANTAYDGQWDVPTLDEIIALVKRREQETGRRIGLYPETKHPSHFRALGLPLEERLVATLTKAGYDGADDPVFVQSFEVDNLKRLNAMTKLPLIQLMASVAGPPDQPGMTYAAMSTPEGLAEIALYADGVGLEKAMVIPRSADGKLAAPSSIVKDAHAAGLKVHVWTFRRENYFLPADFKAGDSPVAVGNVGAEIRAFLATGIDGLFSDNVAEAVAAKR